MQILDVATIAALCGADWPVAAIEAGDWYDTTGDLVAWARRVYPGVAPIRHYVFAALVHTHVTSWSEPWSLDEHPLYLAGERLIRHARGGSQGADAPFVQTITVDEAGRHAPPGASLPEWTAWVWGRLVALLLAEGEGEDA